MGILLNRDLGDFQDYDDAGASFGGCWIKCGMMGVAHPASFSTLWILP